MPLINRQSPSTPSGRLITRRDMLRGSAASLLASSLAGPALANPRHSYHAARAVIWINLVGGPSQLETFDPKPDATSSIRGPFSSIPTKIAGARFSEHLPGLAARADRLTILRSLHHEAAPIHETGFQLLQTGRLFDPDQLYPHFGSVVARVQGPQGQMPPFVILPAPIGATGVKISHGQTAGPLGPQFDAWLPSDSSGSTLARMLEAKDEAKDLPDRYGRTELGRDCLRARRLVEAGTRVVVVNMGTTVFDTVSWDAHGRAPFSTLKHYAETLLPTLDWALSALLDDLAERCLLDSTLVLATGEFGRSPRINAYGGRDHWPGVWSGVMAGGGVGGGRVVGASDRQASEPADQPVALPDLLASLYHLMGLDPRAVMTTDQGLSFPLVDQGQPIRELLA